MIYIGQYNTLEILRLTSVGLYLGDGEGFEVLLPNKYVPEKYEIGDSIRVFLYKDGQDRPVATNLVPKIKVNEFAYLKVNHINAYGAFLDWGLEKDLFVPYSEQVLTLKEGRSYIVYMYLDKSSARLVASTKWIKFLKKEPTGLVPGQKVEILVAERVDLGFNVIIDGEYKGLVYGNEIFQPVRTGDRLPAFIKTIREDNKIDVTLQAQGFPNQIEDSTEKILRALKENDGFLPLNDNSSPDSISDLLQMSKKNFKKSTGVLYKLNKITLTPEGIRLNVE